MMRGRWQVVEIAEIAMQVLHRFSLVAATEKLSF
jgi:hypothetical protein